MTPSLQLADPLIAGSTHAIGRSVQFFLRTQADDGYWWADLTADSTLESDYILLLLWLYPPTGAEWNPPCRDRVRRAADSILQRQLPDGGFNIYPQGPADVSATVKAYVALKLAGLAQEDPRMVRTRETILRLGGIQAANSYVKLNLSFFGLYPRQHVPSIPPEMILFPGNFIYQMSSWTRAIVIPLAIVHSMNPMRPVPPGFDLSELFLPNVPLSIRRNRKLFTWRNLFLAIDRAAKWWERYGSQSLRTRAVRRAEQWMLERTRYSDGLGAIYPPMMYAIMALDLLGYPTDHPDRVEALRQFENLIVQDQERFFFQPCFSVVWDAAIASFAVGEARNVLPATAAALVSECDSALERCAGWLVSKEVRRRGDWSVKRPNLEPSGWYFEFANESYPDIDDTAMVLLGLSQTPGHQSGKQAAAIKRSLNWLLNMQSKDGGWAAFDADNNWKALADVPFADHNAMLDPTCPDITGRVLEALMSYGVAPGSEPARRAIEYLRRTQEQDGSWYGRWGVDYI
jgi:squalene-hopene/tetraprenyl-beta-curcumene cyclase